jgi:hypothetical protein
LSYCETTKQNVAHLVMCTNRMSDGSIDGYLLSRISANVRNSKIIPIPPSGCPLHKHNSSPTRRRPNPDISIPPHPDTDADANHHTRPSALKSHDCTTSNSIVGTSRSIPRNKKLCPRRIPPRIPTDFDPCRAKLTDPLVPLIRFRVAASRASPFGRAAGQAVRVRDACWAARLGGREVGAVQKVAVGCAALVEFEPEVGC